LRISINTNWGYGHRVVQSSQNIDSARIYSTKMSQGCEIKA